MPVQFEALDDWSIIYVLDGQLRRHLGISGLRVYEGVLVGVKYDH